MIDICAVGLMIGMSGVVHGHVKRPQSVGCPVITRLSGEYDLGHRREDLALIGHLRRYQGL